MKKGSAAGTGDGWRKMELAATKAAQAKFVLRLYLSGTNPQSQRALSNVRRICEGYLKDRYELQVFDIYQNPVRATEDQVVAVPTLVKVSPGPLRRLVGDLSDEARVLAGLGLSAKGAQA